MFSLLLMKLYKSTLQKWIKGIENQDAKDNKQ